MPEPKLKYASLSVAVVAVLHFAGAILLMFSNGKVYEATTLLTPVNLLLTSALVFYFQKDVSRGFLQFLSIGFLTGLGVEMLGVNTGLIFGQYTYGPVLGPQIWNTPLLIGLNWVLISYCIGCMVQNFSLPKWPKVFAGVSLLVLLDYFMEPVAMKHNFWSWSNGSIPNQNYLGWACCGFILMLLFFQLPFEKKNSVAVKVGLIQFGFFFIQNLF